MIGIVDYGAGNLRSVQKALVHLDTPCRIVSTPEQINTSGKLVLPGVGAFGAAVERLKAAGLYRCIQEWLKDDRPFLGICLGMQLLMESSSETSGSPGFGYLPGTCLRFGKLKVPQIGWNQIDIKRHTRLLDGIPQHTFFYFLHGYYLDYQDVYSVTAVTDYGLEYPSIIEKGNVTAVQFHPEKSGAYGMRILKNWIESC